MGDVGNCIDVSQHRGASTASTGHRDLSGHLRIRARTNTQAYRVHVSLIRILVCTIAFLRTSRAMPRKYVTVVSRMWFYSCIHTAYAHVCDQMNERKKIAAGAAAFAKGEWGMSAIASRRNPEKRNEEEGNKSLTFFHFDIVLNNERVSSCFMIGRQTCARNSSSALGATAQVLCTAMCTVMCTA